MSFKSYDFLYSWLVQSVEHETLDLGVMGRNPAFGELLYNKQDRVCIFFDKKLHRMRAKDAPNNIFTYL